MSALLFSLLILGADAGGARPPAPTGNGIHHIYLVRHGIYDRDPAATDDRTHNGLNPKGHQQAKKIGERLAGLPVRFDRLISSGLLRAKETSDDMGRLMHMTPTRDEALNECAPSTFAVAGSATCDAARAEMWSRYFAPTPQRDRTDVLVAHGNVIRWTLLRAVGADTRGWDRLDSANASLTIIAVWPDGTTRLVMYDDVGHLPVELQTWSGPAGGWGVAK